MLDVDLPVLAAPMAGGPTTPALVIEAARAGSLGFLAAGYRTAEQLMESVREVRGVTESFGVNLFAPPPISVDPGEYERYARTLRICGIELPAEPIEDDDGWDAKLDALLHEPVPAVSFTFGIPTAATIAAFRKAGTITIQTVTSAHEARLARAAGVDALVAQSTAAGGHYGTLTPRDLPPALELSELVRAVVAETSLPTFAAGGVSTPAAVAAALSAGAEAAVVGTALLLADEAGTSAPYRRALAERRETVVTKAFTGRPARGLRNAFIDEHEPDAPFGYPAIHHLTRPIRQASAADDDAERVNLWAGTGYREAATGPAAEILRRLAAR